MTATVMGALLMMNLGSLDDSQPAPRGKKNPQLFSLKRIWIGNVNEKLEIKVPRSIGVLSV